MSNYEPPAPPPPPGGYGAPPPAGPPADPPGGIPGGYGGPPPGAPGGYGGPGGASWDVGAAVSYGWAKFQANAGQMVLAALAIFVGIVVIEAIVFFAILGSSDGGILGLIIALFFYVLLFVYAQVVGAGLIRESLGVAEGRPFTTAGVFKFDNIGPVVITSLLVGAGTFVGYLLCFLPGLIFAFLTMYSLFFVVHRNLEPMDAIKASIDLVKNNLGPTIIWYLVASLIVMVGAILCGIGLLVAIPVVLVGSAYTFKTLLGEPVAP